jgi:hypothetical protein
MMRGETEENISDLKFAFASSVPVFMSFFYLVGAPKKQVKQSLYRLFLIISISWFLLLTSILVMKGLDYAGFNTKDFYQYAWGGVEAGFALAMGFLIPKIFQRNKEWK